MRYVLVDKENNVVHTIDLASNIGVTGARTYFMGVKRIESKEFDKLWKVKTEAAHLKGQYEWWKEDKEITDSELKF